jgi:quercetin dioxygenase-like cupin family protein
MAFIVTQMVTSSTVSVRPRARLRHASEVEARQDGGGWVQWMVDARLGAEHLMTFIYRLDAGNRSAAHAHPSEEVMYVLDGQGEALRGEVADPIAAGDSLSIPAGVAHALRNPSFRPLLLFGAMAPVIDRAGIVPVDRLSRPSLALPRPTREGEASVTLMGERSFRVLAGPQTGCREMTQFTGLIPPGRAPLHAHPHEECVYVLSGRGRLWTGDEVAGELSPESAAFIPIGVQHTLENTGAEEVLKVLGVFSPAGSPAAKLPSE